MTVTGSVSASSTVSPDILDNSGPVTAFQDAFNEVVDWFDDKADDVADISDNVSSISDIPGAIWNYVVNKILKLISYPIGLLAGAQAWYEATWVELASDMAPTVSGSSIALIKAVFMFLVFLILIRFWVLILDIVPIF